MLVIFQNMWVTGQNNTLWATYPLSLWIKYEYLIYIEWSNKRISKRIIPRQETRIPYAGNRAWRLFGDSRYRLILWVSSEASLMPQPLFCRLLQQTDRWLFPALPVPLWVFNPFKCNLWKGLKTHRGRGFASKSFKPSASADGKREADGA